MITLDADGGVLTDALFAKAYRQTVPILADAKHVTVRIHPARAQELYAVAGDVSDIVEVGEVSEIQLNGTYKNTKRIIAVPVSVHIADGAEFIEDDTADFSVVAFQINGITELQLIHLKMSDKEVEDRRVAADKAAADAKVEADKKDAADLEVAKADAFRKARREAAIKQAEAAGAADGSGGSEMYRNPSLNAVPPRSRIATETAEEDAAK